MDLLAIKYEMLTALHASDYPLAVRYANLVLRMSPGDVDATIHKAGMLSLGLVAEDCFEEAECLIMSLVEGDPSDPRRWAAAAVIVERSGEPDRSEEYCRKALELDSLNYVAIIQMATLVTEGQPGISIAFEEARILLERLVEAHPMRWLPHMYLGRVLASEGRHKEAAEADEKAVALSAGGDPPRITSAAQDALVKKLDQFRRTRDSHL